jgi:hypothetical protein
MTSINLYEHWQLCGHVYVLAREGSTGRMLRPQIEVFLQHYIH